MNATDVIAMGLERNAKLVGATLADFSDAEMLIRPAPGANHAAWQLGHIAAADAYFLGLVGGPAIELPAGYMEKFGNKTTHIDDPAFFPPKAEMLEALGKAHAATAAWIRTLSPADLEKPMDAKWHMFAVNVGEMLNMITVHASLHVGQMQVARRKLGKPVLF